MDVVELYSQAQHEEKLSRLRRVMALRGLRATGYSQQQIADLLGISQPAISQQLKMPLDAILPADLVRAAAPILVSLASDRGFSDLAVFGSVARGEAGPDSDIDLIIRPAKNTDLFELFEFSELCTSILGRPVDLVSYNGLKSKIDDDILRDLKPLS